MYSQSFSILILFRKANNSEYFITLHQSLSTYTFVLNLSLSRPQSKSQFHNLLAFSHSIYSLKSQTNEAFSSIEDFLFSIIF